MVNKDTNTYALLTFIAHLPFVKAKHENTSLLEERWFFDALISCYIPFIETLRRVCVNKKKVSICLSPTFLAMCVDSDLLKRFHQYLNMLLRLGDDEKNRLRVAGESEILELCNMHYDRLLEVHDIFVNIYQKDLLAQWRALLEDNNAEFCTSAFSHAFLPNFRSFPKIIEAQIKNGVKAFSYFMNDKAKGFWLPECGYYEGVEKILEKYDIQYSFCDPRSLFHSNEIPNEGSFLPVKAKNSSIVFFPRDVYTTDRVWSSRSGYSAHNLYLDYYQDVGFNQSLDYVNKYLPDSHTRVMTGYKYFARKVLEVNDKANVSPQQMIYNPALAQEQVKQDSFDFIKELALRKKSIQKHSDIQPVITPIFDIELFGHFWYEGISWLEESISNIHLCDATDDSPIVLTSPSEVLKEYKQKNIALQEIPLSFFSWSDKGHAQVWLNSSNKKLYKEIYTNIERFEVLMSSGIISGIMTKRIATQALRELMLAQSSDWPFIMNANQVVNFALASVREHLNNFKELYDMLYKTSLNVPFLLELEKHHLIIPNVNMDMFYKSLD